MFQYNTKKALDLKSSHTWKLMSKQFDVRELFGFFCFSFLWCSICPIFGFGAKSDVQSSRLVTSQTSLVTFSLMFFVMFSMFKFWFWGIFIFLSCEQKSPILYIMYSVYTMYYLQHNQGKHVTLYRVRIGFFLSSPRKPRILSAKVATTTTSPPKWIRGRERGRQLVAGKSPSKIWVHYLLLLYKNFLSSQ